MTDENLPIRNFRLAANKDFRFEMNAEGEFEIMPPPLSKRAEKIGNKYQLRLGREKIKPEKFFESSASSLCRTARNGAGRFLDFERKIFCPSEKERSEEVLHILFRISSSNFARNRTVCQNLKRKMREYIENGVRLGWLIDPYEKRVHIYRANGEIEILENAEKVSGENVLNGFELDLTEIF